MDETNRLIINRLQGGFPISERPFAEAASGLGLAEDELIRRIERLLADKALTRFGPLFNADRMGGSNCLAAMAVPRERFEAVAAEVNAFPEVAHNYERDHALNMWFVLATERPERIGEVARAIEARTGIAVLLMPKEAEFFVDLRFAA